MTYVRNMDQKMKVQTEESFQKTIMVIIVGCSLCVLFNCLYYNKDG